MEENIISSSVPLDESWYNDFAEKLLSENFLLTALEFHAELTESGKELPKLKNFFSNPVNFEHQASAKPEVIHSFNLSRSLSQATLDSLDLTRYSEDGERSNDDRVAVLEFELRKAKETISALRANLTEATESVTNKTNKDKNSKNNQSFSKEQLCIKPHEQRALNFLINEYLLHNGYKLTSITFADENESQDFDDWDDVGLNCARPSELLNLYREGLKSTGFLIHVERKHFGCQVTMYDETQHNLCINELESEIADLTNKLVTVSTNSAKNMDLAPNDLKTFESDLKNSLVVDSECFEIIEATKNHKELETPSDKSNGDWTEIKQSFLQKLCYSNSGSTENLTTVGNFQNEVKFNLNEEKNENKNLGCNLDEYYENCDNIDELNKNNNSKNILNLINVSREMPERFKNEIYSLCDIGVPVFNNNDVLATFFQESEMTCDCLIDIISDSLPKIIPNIILNKREEIIPLLVLCICFNTKSSVRDKLLNLLFNLKKKPQAEERSVILKALLVIAKLKGLCLVENEILPQCWEQITHKYIERRILVAESCFLLTPFVSETIRNSLIISITQQLLLDREDTVRKASVNILAILIVLISDKDKYNKILDLCLRLLNDESSEVLNAVNQILFPTLAQWSFSLNRIQSDLYFKLLNKLKKGKELSVIHLIKILLPYLVLEIANSEFLRQFSGESSAVPSKRSEYSYLCKGLCDPALFFEGSLNKVMSVFDSYTSNADFDSSKWTELNWIFQVFIPSILDAGDSSWEDSTFLKALVLTLRYLCLGLGKSVTNYKIKPFLLEKLSECENAVVSGEECNYSIIPMYLVGVLSAYPEEFQEMSNTLRRFICALPLCGVSLIPLEVTVEILSQYQPWHILVLDAIWEGVVHQRPLVRSGTAILLKHVIPHIPDSLLGTKLMPALVTLTSDPETTVRSSAVPALGMLINAREKAVKDKVYITFQTLLQDSVSLENLSFIIQLIKTIIVMYESCEPKFKDEVFVPQLSEMAALALRVKNKELTEVLIDAFSAVTVSQSQLTFQCINGHLLSGLRRLENLCNHLNLPYSEHMDCMIRETERQLSGSKEITSKAPVPSSTEVKKNIPAVSGHTAVNDVKNRVTKIFNTRPNSFQNVSGIFKKKI